MNQSNTACLSKPILIKWCDDLIAEGNDISAMYHVSVIKLFYKQRPAYFYVVEDKHIYTYLFGNNWKKHLREHEDDSAIWKYMERLDNTGWLCLNDQFNQSISEYEKAPSRFPSFEDYYKVAQPEEKQIVLKFIEKLQKNLELLYDEYHHWESDKELILQAILHIYITDKNFFLHNIEIEQKNFEKITGSLRPSLAISAYNKDTLESSLDCRPGEKNKVVKV